MATRKAATIWKRILKVVGGEEKKELFVSVVGESEREEKVGRVC